MPIVAAVDGERAPDAVVSTAAEVADAFGEELVVLHVMTDDRYERLREAERDESNRVVTVEDVSYSVSAAERAGEKYTVDAAAEDAAGVAREVARATLGTDADFEAVGRVGDVVSSVVDVAEDHGARYLVIGGRKRTPVGKAVFGSATQSVLLNSPRSVITVMRD